MNMTEATHFKNSSISNVINKSNNQTELKMYNQLGDLSKFSSKLLNSDPEGYKKFVCKKFNDEEFEKLKERNRMRAQNKSKSHKKSKNSQIKAYALTHRGKLRMPLDKIQSFKYFKDENKPSFTFKKYLKIHKNFINEGKLLAFCVVKNDLLTIENQGKYTFETPKNMLAPHTSTHNLELSPLAKPKSSLNPEHLKAIESVNTLDTATERIEVMTHLLERTDLIFDLIDKHKFVYKMENFLDDLNEQAALEN